MTSVFRFLPIRNQAGGPDYEPPVTPSKAPLTGLVARTTGSVGARAADLGGVVAETRWNVLQPTEFGPIDTAATTSKSWKEIIDALATGLPVKIRVLTGQHAPQWVKDAAGTVTIGDPNQGNAAVVCPKFWEPYVLSAWSDLMTKMAALLEADPQVREIASHHACTIFGEPFIRNTRGVYGGVPNLKIMYDAGLTRESEKENLARPFDRIGDTSRWEALGWTSTRLYIPFNPFSYWDYDLNDEVVTVSDTVQLISTAYSSLGKHFVGGNNSYRSPVWRTGGAWKTGTAQSATADTITLKSSETGTQALMQGGLIGIRSGTGVGQYRTISDYTSLTKVLTVSEPWDTQPDGTSEYAICTAPTLDNKYVQLYSTLTGSPGAVGIQTSNDTNIVSAWNQIPGHKDDAPIESLRGALDQLFGILRPSTGDPEHMMTGSMESIDGFRARYVELPGSWNTWGLTSPECLEYNTVAAGNPIG